MLYGVLSKMERKIGVNFYQYWYKFKTYKGISWFSIYSDRNCIQITILNFKECMP